MRRRDFIKRGLLWTPSAIAGLNIFTPTVRAQRSNRRLLMANNPVAAAGGGAAIVKDSWFEKGLHNQNGSMSFVSNAGDVTGGVGSNSNRGLFGFIAFRTDVTEPSAVAMTWNSVSMTQIGSKVNFASVPYALWAFGLINPATGNQTLSSTWTGGNVESVTLGALSLYNVHQTTAWQNAGTDSGAASSGTNASSTVTTANGNCAVAFHGDDNASTLTIGSSPIVEAWKETDLNGNYGLGYVLSTGASATINWTMGTQPAWAHLKFDVIKA